VCLKTLLGYGDQLTTLRASFRSLEPHTLVA
jgi:hypothetical protein